MNLMYEDRDEAGLRTTGISPLQWGAFPRPIRGRHLIGTVTEHGKMDSPSHPTSVTILKRPARQEGLVLRADHSGLTSF